MHLDRAAEESMTLIVAAIVSRMGEEGWHEPCRAGIMPGLEVPLDYCAGDCEGGMVWARLVSITPLTAVDDATGAPCATGMSAVIEVGMSGSVALPYADDMGNITVPSQEENTTATHLQLQQMRVMHDAVACTTFPMGRASIGAYGPFGPEGGCVGGVWLVTVPLI